jgi:hypothetical protein
MLPACPLGSPAPATGRDAKGTAATSLTAVVVALPSAYPSAPIAEPKGTGGLSDRRNGRSNAKKG